MVEQSPWFCPRCRSRLAQLQASAVTLHGCGACGGIWLNNADCQRVVSALPQEIRALSQNAAANARTKPDVEAKLQCPECSYALERNWPVPGLGLDVCGVHGTWFDASELHTVVQRMRVEKAYGKLNQAARRSSAIGYMPDYSRRAADDDTGEDVSEGLGVAVGVLGALFELASD